MAFKGHFGVKMGKMIKVFEKRLVCPQKKAILGDSCVSPRQGLKHKENLKYNCLSKKHRRYIGEDRTNGFGREQKPEK